MKARKLNYRIHDPNPTAVTAGCILKIFIEANAGKVERAIREAADTSPRSGEGANDREGHSAS